MLKIRLFKKFTKFTGKNSRILRIKNAKFSGYCFYINTNMELDFQICISVPLRWRHPITTIRKYRRVISIFTIPCTSNKYAIYKNILFQRIGNTSDVSRAFLRKPFSAGDLVEAAKRTWLWSLQNHFQLWTSMNVCHGYGLFTMKNLWSTYQSEIVLEESSFILY